MRHWAHSRTSGVPEAIGAGLAGETPSGGELIGGEDGGVSFRDGERTGEHADAAASALARAAAGEFDTVRGEAGDERGAARHIELDGEGLETNADARRR